LNASFSSLFVVYYTLLESPTLVEGESQSVDSQMGTSVRRRIMKNVEMTVEGDKLVIVVDLRQELGISSSGKSIMIAGTEGNVSVPGREDIKIGLNIYKPRPKD